MMAQAKRPGNGAGRRARSSPKASAVESTKSRRNAPVTNTKAGRLIAVEGVDGSGKSTQLHLLEQWLRHQNLKVFKTEWNSSETVKEIT